MTHTRGNDPVPRALHRVADLLVGRGWWLSTAESCTGGLLAHTVTNLPGASHFFERGFVTYSNDAKVEHLGVSRGTIGERGAVSPEVALEMVRGLRRVTGSEVCVAITGIAGPGGGTPEKPVGLVYIGYSVGGEAWVEEKHFPGGRVAFKRQVVEHVLGELELRLASTARGSKTQESAF
ncbi:MAG: CinA family protein [Promethearchaeota archaeon]